MAVLGKRKPGDVLRSMRKALGLTMSKAASLVGVPVRTYEKWERGERTPRVNKWLDIITILEHQGIERGIAVSADDVDLGTFKEIKKDIGKLFSSIATYYARVFAQTKEIVVEVICPHCHKENHILLQPGVNVIGECEYCAQNSIRSITKFSLAVVDFRKCEPWTEIVGDEDEQLGKREPKTSTKGQKRRRESK